MYQTTVISLLAGICFVVDFVTGVTVDSCAWFLLLVPLMEGYPIWRFCKERVASNGVRFLAQLFTYCWFFKIGLKVIFSAVLIIKGVNHQSSQGMVVVLASYYVANLCAALCRMAIKYRSDAIGLIEVYRIIYKLWRVVLSVQFSLVLFNLDDDFASKVGLVLLPTLLFSVFGLIAVSFMITIKLLKYRKKHRQRAKIGPLRMSSDKGSALQDSMNASIDPFNFSSPHAEVAHVQPSSRNEQSNCLYLYFHWAAIFLFSIIVDVSLQRNNDLLENSVWIKCMAAIMAFGSAALAVVGGTFQNLSM